MDARFFRSLERWGKKLQVVVIILLSTLVSLQIVMAEDSDRFYLTFAEQLEGVPDRSQYSVVQGLERNVVGEIKIEADTPFPLPEVAVCINGKQVANFQKEQVEISVRTGDDLAIDGTAYPYTILFRVKAVSEGICWPRAGCQIETCGDWSGMGKVRIE